MKKLSEQVIGCALAVSRTLKQGFLERVYENALEIEFTEAGLLFVRQHPLAVRYRDRLVGEYVCDFLVAEKLIVEVKAVASLAKEHEWQVLNYLSATGIKVGLLLNFGGSRLEVKRVVSAYEDDDSI